MEHPSVANQVLSIQELLVIRREGLVIEKSPGRVWEHGRGSLLDHPAC
jgi:hypothetical protein